MSASYQQIVWALARPPISTLPELGVTQAQDAENDRALVDRVQEAYRTACGVYAGSASAWDVTIGEIKRPIHEALLARSAEPASTLLRDPASNSHFWGFDAVCKAPAGEVEPHELVLRRLDDQADWKRSYARWLHDALVSLAEAVGACRMFYPETTPGYHYELYGEPGNVDRILDEIEGALAAPIRFPNPYPGELGLLTANRGIASFRAIQALYQAWRLRQLSHGQDDFRVLEIGAGLGRTAYFARALGISDYTIVDIPLTNAAQGYFLGRTLGSDNIVLFNEESRKHATRVLPPASLEGMTETFDVVLNVDSFTEMSLETMESYWRFCRSNAETLLSINHEINPNRVRELYLSDPAVSVSRFPYWMRRGYVEEHVRWKHRKPRVE
jgi:SAM-dependent methyltransferase